MALGIFQKLNTGDALIRINVSREHILSFPSSWLKRKSAWLLLWQERSSWPVFWQGGKSDPRCSGKRVGSGDLAERVEKQKSLLGKAERHGQGRGKEQHCKIKA